MKYLLAALLLLVSSSALAGSSQGYGHGGQFMACPPK